VEKAFEWLKAKPWHWLLVIAIVVLIWFFFLRGSSSSSASSGTDTSTSNLAGYYALEAAATNSGNALQSQQVAANAATGIAQIQAQTQDTSNNDLLQALLAEAGVSENNDNLSYALGNNEIQAGLASQNTNLDWQQLLLSTGQTNLLTPTVAPSVAASNLSTGSTATQAGPLSQASITAATEPALTTD
jgi:hypothetical protein